MTLEFDVFAADDPNGAVLETLTEAYDKAIRVEKDGPGSGKFTIRRDSAQASPSIIAQSNLVKVRYTDVSEDYIFAFWLETLTAKIVSEEEGGGEELTFAGKGALAYLDRARMWWQSHLTSPFVGESPTNGIWVAYAAGTGNEPGQLIRRIIAEAQAQPAPHPTSGTRPQFPLADLTVDFDYAEDSNGNAWTPTDATNEYTIPVGSSVYELVLQLTTFGVTVQMSPDLVLSCYDDFGTDRTSTTFASGKVRFARAANIATPLQRDFQPPQVKSHVLAGGPNFVYGEGELAVSPIREEFVSANAITETALDAVADAELVVRQVHADAITIGVLHGNTPLSGLYEPGPPGVGHYWVGDQITVHTGAGNYDYANADWTVAAIMWEETEAGDVDITLDLGSQYIPGIGGAAPLTPPTTGTCTCQLPLTCVIGDATDGCNFGSPHSSNGTFAFDVSAPANGVAMVWSGCLAAGGELDIHVDDLTVFIGATSNNYRTFQLMKRSPGETDWEAATTDGPNGDVQGHIGKQFNPTNGQNLGDKDCAYEPTHGGEGDGNRELAIFVVSGEGYSDPDAGSTTRYTGTLVITGASNVATGDHTAWCGLDPTLLGQGDADDTTYLRGDRVWAPITDITDPHINDGDDAHDASAISFDPVGDISATNVQDAIEEVAAGVVTTPGVNVGRTHLAYPLGTGWTDSFDGTNVDLPANGGARAAPYHISSPMYLESVSVRNLDGSGARTWGWDLYYQSDDGVSTGTLVASSNANESFTAAGTSTRTIVAAGAPVLLQAGVYWLVVQNRHATQTFRIGLKATAGSFQTNVSQSKTLTVPPGAGLEMSTGWTQLTSTIGAIIRGRVWGESSVR